MDDTNIFSTDELKFLTALTRHGVEFMVIGLSGAALQGASAVTMDIDLWFKNINDPSIKEALNEVGGILVPPVGLHPPMLGGEAVKLFDIVLTVHGVGSFDEEVKTAVIFKLGDSDIKVLALDRIIASKRYLSRDKDLLVLKVLEDALNTRRTQE